MDQQSFSLKFLDKAIILRQNLEHKIFSSNLASFSLLSTTLNLPSMAFKYFS
ncbi:hypothetical protein FORMB_16830 [Formosa sp. Hel1_33_131]|nr:hypothetical protein FORMB_16830 [Formosa sp. Hel1_33_131]